MQQADKRNVRKHTETFNDKLRQAFKKYIAINAAKPTVEGLTQEVMSIYEEYCKQVGLPIYKHSDSIQVPQILRDQFLMDDKLVAKTAADAQAIMDAMRNDTELKQLLSNCGIAGGHLAVYLAEYKIDLKSMITSSQEDLIAQFYISSLKKSKEYKALNNLVKYKYGEDKNLEDVNLAELAKDFGPYNTTFNNAVANYKKVELATKICIQKAKVMSKELDSNPEEKARYEKYLLSNAHKKHMQEFERVRGMSYVEHEALTLKAFEYIVNLDTFIKEQVTTFVDTIGKEDIDLKAKNDAVRISNNRTADYIALTVISMLYITVFAVAPLIITSGLFPPIFPIVACVTVMAVAVTGIAGVVAHEVRKDPQKYQTTAIENTLNSVALNNKVYNEGLYSIAESAASVLDSMQALELKQTKAASKGA